MVWNIYCSHKQLQYDEACLRINTSVPVSLYSQVNECFKCNLLPLANVSDYLDIIVGTVYPTEILIANKKSNCSLNFHFSQLGIFGLNITHEDHLVCSGIYNISPASDVYKPLWVLMSVLFICLFLWGCILPNINVAKLRHCIGTNRALRDLQNDLGEPSDTTSRLVGAEFSSSSPSPTPGFRPRVKAIDTFRGLTIALMIFVNSGGGNYSIFQHSPWNGLTIADYIFPWFIWIMGFSTVMSVKNQIRADRRRHQLFVSAIKRTITLLVLGIILNSMSTIDLNYIRLPGVLQRIAITYFIVAVLEICFVTPEYVAVGNSCHDNLSDILSCWAQWIVVLFMVGIHTYLSFGVAYEHCPSGYLGPGGLANSSFYENCTGGFASYLDRMVFTPNHMYRHPTPQPIYHTTIPVDPEGLLGIFTSCLTAFLGVQAGQILLSFYNPYKRLSRWLIWAFITGIVGGLLCGFSQEEGHIPINKNLWSLSYTLVTSSAAFLILVVFYLLVDHWMYWDGTPLIQTGRNSILLYFASCVIGGLFPFKWKPLVDSQTHSEYLIMNTFGTAIWITIAYILSSYKIYLTV